MSLFTLLAVSGSGLSAQRYRAQLLVENMANAETTRTAEGGPYRRKDAVFAAEPQASPFSAAFQAEIAGPAGVAVADVVEDRREPLKRFLPGHPDADANGYVAFPRVNPAEDMVDLMNAARGYQANVSAIGAVRDMINRTVDLMR